MVKQEKVTITEWGDLKFEAVFDLDEIATLFNMLRFSDRGGHHSLHAEELTRIVADGVFSAEDYEWLARLFGRLFQLRVNDEITAMYSVVRGLWLRSKVLAKNGVSILGKTIRAGVLAEEKVFLRAGVLVKERVSLPAMAYLLSAALNELRNSEQIVPLYKISRIIGTEALNILLSSTVELIAQDLFNIMWRLGAAPAAYLEPELLVKLLFGLCGGESHLKVPEYFSPDSDFDPEGAIDEMVNMYQTRKAFDLLGDEYVAEYLKRNAATPEEFAEAAMWFSDKQLIKYLQSLPKKKRICFYNKLGPAGQSRVPKDSW